MSVANRPVPAAEALLTLRAARLIAVIRADDSDEALAIAGALAAGGVQAQVTGLRRTRGRTRSEREVRK